MSFPIPVTFKYYTITWNQSICTQPGLKWCNLHPRIVPPSVRYLKSHWCCWGYKSPGMQRLLGECFQTFWRIIVDFMDCLTLDTKGSIILQNVRNHSPSDTSLPISGFVFLFVYDLGNWNPFYNLFQKAYRVCICYVFPEEQPMNVRLTLHI